MSNKKEVRRKFREVCLKRDRNRCVMCGLKAKSDKEIDNTIFDVHHVTDRTLMPNGGYVLENGITLCHKDHLLAEQFHSTGIAYSGFSPEELYKKIGSSYEKALRASEKL